jgi:predicted small secreted protein
MRRRLLVVGIVLVVAAALAGCDLIDGIIDSITGGGSGGGSVGFGAVVSGRLEFHLAAYITEDTGMSTPGTVGTTFFSSGGSYNATTKTFTATWDGGDFSNTYFEARLNYTEEYIEYFYARQTQSGVWGAWTYVHEIRGYNVLYSHTDGTSRYFVVDGSDAHVIVDVFVYKAWSTSLGSAQSPVEWVSVSGALTGATDDIISIRLDY